jgi:hypothetical protein
VRLASIVTIALVLTAPTLTRADSILVGTDLSNIRPGAGLCPLVEDCTVRVSQFTLVTAVEVHDIKIAVSGPFLDFGTTSGQFGVSLSSQLPALNGERSTNGNIGSGDLVFDLNSPTVTQVFDFGHLGILLEPGTYYLEVQGENLEWDVAPPLATSAGAIGLQLSCDPDVNCGSDISRYDGGSGGAWQILGTVVTPEPSSWVLFGTGVLGIAGVARLKFVSLS